MIPAVADFDVAAMQLEVNEFDAKKAGKELDLTDLDPGKIDMNLKWWLFKWAFLTMDKNATGVDNNPII